LRLGLGVDDRQRALAQHPVDGHLGARMGNEQRRQTHTKTSR
jgi:hypothetical protein